MAAAIVVWNPLPQPFTGLIAAISNDKGDEADEAALTKYNDAALLQTFSMLERQRLEQEPDNNGFL